MTKSKTVINPNNNGYRSSTDIKKIPMDNIPYLNQDLDPIQFNKHENTVNPLLTTKRLSPKQDGRRKKADYKTGHLCETLAMMWLIIKGYWPIAKNYVVGRGTGAGEIDLIMTKGKTLVFIEVKKRPTYQEGLHAITLDNQMRVIRASAAFLKRYPSFSSYKIRYDAVIFSPRSWPKHLKDAWRVL